MVTSLSLLLTGRGSSCVSLELSRIIHLHLHLSVRGPFLRGFARFPNPPARARGFVGGLSEKNHHHKNNKDDHIKVTMMMMILINGLFSNHEERYDDEVERPCSSL